MGWNTFCDPATCTRAQLEEEARKAERVAKAYRDELALRPERMLSSLDSSGMVKCMALHPLERLLH